MCLNVFLPAGGEANWQCGYVQCKRSRVVSFSPKELSCVNAVDLLEGFPFFKSIEGKRFETDD